MAARQEVAAGGPGAGDAGALGAALAAADQLEGGPQLTGLGGPQARLLQPAVQAQGHQAGEPTGAAQHRLRQLHGVLAPAPGAPEQGQEVAFGEALPLARQQAFAGALVGGEIADPHGAS
ncbi:MAG: hypothetical protein NTW40_11535 [Acidobacteria bacterium]|nr:hypothetical protein [Acidobacteriota bacterium]